MNKFCTICYENAAITICKSCNNQLCGGCIVDYNISDNLSVQLICSKCDDKICPNCIYFCYECVDGTTDYDLFCLNCKPNSYYYIGCKFHKRITCGNHQNQISEKCVNCSSFF